MPAGVVGVGGGSFGAVGGTYGVVGVSEGPPPILPDYWNSAEGGVDTDDVTTGNSGGDSGIPWSDVSAAANQYTDDSLKGSLSYICTGGDPGLLRWEKEADGDTEACTRFYFRGFPGGVVRSVIGSSSDGALTTAVISTTQITMFNKNNSPSAINIPDGLVEGTVYRLEHSLDQSLGNMRGFGALFVGNSLDAVITRLQTLNETPIVVDQVGFTTSVSDCIRDDFAAMFGTITLIGPSAGSIN